MIVWEGQNLSGTQPVFSDGDLILGCNLSQQNPHTAIGTGVPNLVFRGCNLCNCDVPADAIVEDCLHIHQQTAYAETVIELPDGSTITVQKEVVTIVP